MGSLGPSSYEEAKRAWKKQDEWRRESARRYEERLREEKDSKFRSIGDNPERKKKRRERDFGDKAPWIEDQPCDVCGQVPSEPHHHPTRGAGGTKEDLMPLCETHHRTGATAYHNIGPESFAETHDLNLDERTTFWDREWREYRDESD